MIRIDHVSLDVHDRPAAIAWYEEVLGLRAHGCRDVPDEPVFLGPAGAQLGLFAERAPGLRHVALATGAAEQRRLAARLDRLDIPYRPERHSDSDSIYFADLDGTVLEVMVPARARFPPRECPRTVRLRGRRLRLGRLGRRPPPRRRWSDRGAARGGRPRRQPRDPRSWPLARAAPLGPGLGLADRSAGGLLRAPAVEAGIPYNDDHHASWELDGVGPSQLTIRDGRRQTAAVAFIAPIADHPNLTILTGARALRLRFDGTRCRGVEIARGGRTEVVEASAEVVVSAGTIESPRLLMLSGIGPADELAQHGIASRVDLPGVGRNLHDHLISFVLRGSPIEIPAVRPGLQHHHVHLFWRSRPGLRVPDTQPVGFHLPFGAEWFDLPQHGFTLTPGLVRPHSRGAIRLMSGDPTAPLSLDPRALAVGADLDGLAASVELMREVGRQPALAEWTSGELYPGPEVRTRDEVRDYVRRTVGSYHHQVGTCKMGQDPDAVADPELRVYGVDGLRMADASVMPFITTGNTNAPTFMIGEKAADLLLAAKDTEVVTDAAHA